MSMADSVGYATIYTGSISADGNTITLHSTKIASAPSAKKTTSLHRIIRFDHATHTLSYEINMEAVGEPMQNHLKATFSRESEVVPVSVDEYKANPTKYDFIVDVREESELAGIPALPGSIVNPLGKMYSQGPSKDWTGKNVLWICRSSRRAELIAKDWKNRGFNSFVLTGGLNAWVAAQPK